MSGNFFKGKNDYCEETRFIDDMLSRFDKDRKEVLETLKTTPNKLVASLWKYNSPLSKDDNCLFQMGKHYNVPIEDFLNKKHTISESMVNYYICPQCKNMKRIAEFSSVKTTAPKEPFLLECGERAGKQLIYDEKNINSLYMLLEKNPQLIKNVYKNNPYMRELAQCSSATCRIPLKVSGDKLLKKYDNCLYLASDTFTNATLINWYLYYELNNLKIPSILNTEISFICNNKGYNVSDYIDIGVINNLQNHDKFLAFAGKPSPTSKPDDKSPILSDITKGIISQLFATLKVLSLYDFSYGNYTSDAIKFKEDVVSYMYDDVHVSCPIRLMLWDFSYSACTIKLKEPVDETENLRLYSRNIVAEEEMKKKHYEPMIKFSKNTDGSDSAIYKINDSKKGFKSNILFMYMRHLGFPVYTSSFDSYVLMCLLMSDRPFYVSVMSDEVLKKFWDNMWISNEEEEIINDRLKDIHENPRSLDSKDIDNLLSNISLKCDCLDYSWKFIKENF